MRTESEKVVVTFTHSLDRALSIHVQGLSYDVQTSDGASVGNNKNFPGNEAWNRLQMPQFLSETVEPVRKVG